MMWCKSSNLFNDHSPFGVRQWAPVITQTWSLITGLSLNVVIITHILSFCCYTLNQFLSAYLHTGAGIRCFLILSFFLPFSFVDAAVRSVDNTLTIIIASAVGGAIALLMGFMLLKNFTLFVLSKLAEKKWVKSCFRNHIPLNSNCPPTPLLQ